MYTKITTSGGRRYLQLVEGYRNEDGKVRHRVIANLGRIEELTPRKLDPLISGLNRALGRTGNTASEVISDSARAHGDVFALHEISRGICSPHRRLRRPEATSILPFRRRSACRPRNSRQPPVRATLTGSWRLQRPSGRPIPGCSSATADREGLGTGALRFWRDDIQELRKLRA